MTTDVSATGVPSVRLFFAAMPGAAAAGHLDAAARALPPSPSARLVPAVSRHLTVAFVGNVAATRLPALRAVGARQRTAAFRLRFDAYEYWPKPEVVVAVARLVPPALDQLWRQLHRDLAAEGWALDAKRLRPHVTLARKVAQPPVLPAMSPFDWCVDALHLVRSDTSGSESVYTVVDTWPLLYEPEKH